ncbi:MAG: hypothetical protein C0506_13585 [Anaerolinea sp.]|nr:hypothetical protein [Anaerolinea sp.]
MMTSSPLQTLKSTKGGRRVAAALLVCLSVVAGGAPGASAQTPPAPSFYWPYGIVQIAGTNLTPPAQPVIAFVNGKACGSGATTVAAAAEGTPAGDVGKTVYVIDVLADGAATGERPGCGRAGDPVTLYFPQSGVAAQQPLFKQGGQRVDLDITVQTGFRAALPALAADGSY